MAGGLGSIIQKQIGNSGKNIPIVPSDALLGKASLSRFGKWQFSDLILSLKPDIGEVTTSKTISLTNDDRNTISTGNALTTQISRTIKNVASENFLEGDPDSIRLQECIMKVDVSKLMTETSVAGRDDLVIEYMSRGSYQIDVQLNIASSWAEVMPEKEIKKLIRILESKEPVTVSSRVLNFYKIDRIVIKGFSMPQRAGFVNQQAFYFSAISVSKTDGIEAKIEKFNPF